MKIFNAGNLAHYNEPQFKRFDRLDSYFYLRGPKLEQDRHYYKDFFLDSGAYSAYTKKKVIDLDEYITFIKTYRDYLTHYATLDDIESPEKTKQNTAYMESKGLEPIPVYHYGEPYDVLEELVAKYEFIALGGMVPVSTPNLIPWLNESFARICNKDGSPKVKVHGFGLTTVSLAERYPWYSVDSTSAVMAAAMGRLIMPDGTGINLSEKTGSTSLLERMEIEKRGFDINELRERYQTRQVWNVAALKELEERITANPPKFTFQQLSLV